MNGLYWTNEEKNLIQELSKHDDTIGCWIATRINGASASLACDQGNINMTLLKQLDEKILPLLNQEQ